MDPLLTSSMLQASFNRDNSKKAEASSNISSYQTLKMDNDFVVIIRTEEARKKVVLCEAP